MLAVEQWDGKEKLKKIMAFAEANKGTVATLLGANKVAIKNAFHDAVKGL